MNIVLDHALIQVIVAEWVRQKVPSLGVIDAKGIDFRDQADGAVIVTAFVPVPE